MRTTMTSAAVQRRLLRAPAGLLTVTGLCLVLGVVPPAGAQIITGAAPVTTFTDDFSGGLVTPGNWTVIGNAVTWSAAPSTAAPSCFGSHWDQHLAQTVNSSGSDPASLLAITASDPTSGGFVAADWENFRMEVDITTSAGSQTGLFWAGTPDGLGGGTNDGLPDDAYFVVLADFPAPGSGAKATWTLIRREDDVNSVEASGLVALPSADADTDTLYAGRCYRLRLDWSCGNLRLQVRREFWSGTTLSSAFGCGTGCSASTPDACWCTILDWTDLDGTLNPGLTGVLGGLGSTTTRFDNVETGYFPVNCNVSCTSWPTTWTEVNRDHLAFKYLYEGALFEPDGYGKLNADGSAAYFVDLDTRAPGSTDDNNTNANSTWCNGWNLLVDLPAPAAATDNLDAIRAHLEPMASAVDFEVDTSLATSSFVDEFNQDTTSASYNPIPILTGGSTPIAASLADAYDWYVEQRTTGAWALDAAADCRLWYVVLITDGEEACLGDACSATGPAEAFASTANPVDPGNPFQEPVKVYTIGFSEDVADTSPLRCVANITGGNFYTATDADQLSAILYDVFNEMEEVDRSFVPFQVTPPPSSAGTGSAERDFLTVFPFFIPRNNQTVWDGTLYAFQLNATNPTIPADSDCQIDFTQVIWDAATVLGSRFSNHYNSNDANRKIFMPYEGASSWERRNLLELTTDSTVLAAMRPKLVPPGQSTVSDLEVQEMVNFVRQFRREDLIGAAATDPQPQDPARPSSWPLMGDIYHSQPIVLSPPNNPQFLFDYGFESSATLASYAAFTDLHQHRRRVILAGANDGLLYAFDGGYYDRDSTNFPDTLDLGNGEELFGLVPQGVMDRVWGLTYSDEHQFMVDGRLASSDVYIDYDGDSDKEWRTVALATLRRGGRSVVALDLTQPDPLADTDGDGVFTPPTWQTDYSTTAPGCLSGSTSNCDGDYPRVMWEFTDTDDDNANCPVSATDCSFYQDLGWTWSQPAIARIAIYNSSDPSSPTSQFVAFFGGGWDERGTDATGLHLYGVDVQTGSEVYKYNIGVPVPAGIRVLDSDLDGFHDRVYVADSDGSIWRLQLPGPTDTASSAPLTNGTMTRIYDFRGLTDRQYFFHEPVTVPAVFSGGSFTWGLAFGSGNRADLGEEIDAVSHIFFVLDVGDTTTRTQSDLVNLSYTGLVNLNTDPDPSPATCSDSPLDTANGNYGWYMTLRANEKVNFEASVVSGYVNITSFEPTEDLATDPPDVCGTGSGPTPTATATPDPTAPVVACRTSGIGRIYKLWFECAIAEESGYQEGNDLYTGQETYTIDGTTYVQTTGFGDDAAPVEEFLNVAGNVITNWRQQ